MMKKIESVMSKDSLLSFICFTCTMCYTCILQELWIVGFATICRQIRWFSEEAIWPVVFHIRISFFEFPNILHIFSCQDDKQLFKLIVTWTKVANVSAIMQFHFGNTIKMRVDINFFV